MSSEDLLVQKKRSYALLELKKAEHDGRLVWLPCRDDEDHWIYVLMDFLDVYEYKLGKKVGLFFITVQEWISVKDRLPDTSVCVLMNVGNGISLPTALYVIQGIAEALKGGEG